MAKRPARVFAAEIDGVDARLIEVEVDLGVGLHAFHIVGLADKALSEARERVNAALHNSDVKPPNRENRRITVNLAPADMNKTGSQYDLAIALGYLLATEQIRAFDTSDKVFVGELGLDGRLRPMTGALNIAEMARRKEIDYLFVPEENANEAAAIDGIRVISVRDLRSAIAMLEAGDLRHHVFLGPELQRPAAPDLFRSVRGQERAKRALAIAAAGGHHVLMVGPPGVGKSMLARATAGILPPTTKDEAVEIAKIWSAAGIPLGGLMSARPFREPHHTASAAAILGGGTIPRPGEISLAHRGVLFLDELPEFPRHVIESLRQPMESGSIRVARARGTLVFPARFRLIAAMNPCPCGYYGGGVRDCSCSAGEVSRYRKRVSGPILDRIDIQIEVEHVAYEKLGGENDCGGNLTESVSAACEIQKGRFAHAGRGMTNGEMSVDDIGACVTLGVMEREFIASAARRSPFSPRSYYRMLRVARTIADIERSGEVTVAHIAEAFSYRLRQE